MSNTATALNNLEQQITECLGQMERCYTDVRGEFGEPRRRWRKGGKTEHFRLQQRLQDLRTSYDAHLSCSR